MANNEKFDIEFRSISAQGRLLLKDYIRLVRIPYIKLGTTFEFGALIKLGLADMN